MTYAELVISTAPDMTFPVIALFIIIATPLVWFYKATQHLHTKD